MENLNQKLIEDIVRRLVTEYAAKAKEEEFFKVVDKSGIAMVKTSTVKPEKFDTGKEGDRVYLKDVFTLQESPRIACGVMEMDRSAFDWTLCYDEIDYVIEGTLEIIIDGRKIVGNKGDIILIPNGSSITFSVPEFARFMYVTYPANWSELVNG